MSNLSYVSKIPEKVVPQQLAEYLNHNNPLCISQSACRPQNSTERLLLTTANDIFLALDKRHVSLLTLRDLPSAFDIIDHSILIDMLSFLHEISGACLS